MFGDVLPDSSDPCLAVEEVLTWVVAHVRRSRVSHTLVWWRTSIIRACLGIYPLRFALRVVSVPASIRVVMPVIATVYSTMKASPEKSHPDP